MRIAITAVTAAALIFATSLFTGVVVPSQMGADTKVTKRSIPNYRLHFGGTPVGGYCPGEVGRALEAELIVEPC